MKKLSEWIQITDDKVVVEGMEYSVQHVSLADSAPNYVYGSAFLDPYTWEDVLRCVPQETVYR